MPPSHDHTRAALEGIRNLLQAAPDRGSCTAAEGTAAEFVAGEMRALGVEDVQIEGFQAAPSTYRPYALAFALALVSTAGLWLFGGRWVMVFAALCGALGAWGMLAETDLSSNWLRRLLPRAQSRNAVGIVRPKGPVQSRLVLCAHLDTHRTPIFYSSGGWIRSFGLLVGGAFASMVVQAAAYGLGALLGWGWVRWVGLPLSLLQAFVLVLCLQAELTPFSPGANDNASGVGVILGLLKRLETEPLNRTEVWLAFTGCEEVGAYGMAFFLDTHGQELGADAVYLVLDQVGAGRLAYLTADGLILKHKTHPRALALARKAASAMPDLRIGEQVGIAYTDGLVATKRGLAALTVNTLPPPGAEGTAHWHQMSDLPAYLNTASLEETHDFVWRVLQEIESSQPG